MPLTAAHVSPPGAMWHHAQHWLESLLLLYWEKAQHLGTWAKGWSHSGHMTELSKM